MLNVLIIEDSKLVRWSLKEMLMNENIEVSEAQSCEEACRFMNQKAFDLVFLDQELDQDGQESLLSEMKRSQLNSKVIILSKSDETCDLGVFENLDVVSVVNKPFSTQDVKSIALKALGVNPEKRNDRQ